MMSLCGDQFETHEADETWARKVFHANIVTLDDFLANPHQIIADPRLVILIHGKLYPWHMAAPYFVTRVAFGKDVPIGQLSETLDEKSLNKQTIARQSSWWQGLWWSTTSQQTSQQTPQASPDADCDLRTVSDDALAKEGLEESYRRSLLPTSEELATMRLRPGTNTVEFVVRTIREGERRVSARVFLWRPDAKLVITDIDGAITRSNTRGHLIPSLGRDWSHSGVAKLFSDVVQNGYKIVYLSSRSIGQADMTKDYLSSISQENATLPQGPVLLSPASLLSNQSDSPSYFKMEALNCIRHLFPENESPYYAGFGKVDSQDMVAYKNAGVPQSRVFCVNPSGELQSSNHTFQWRYAHMIALLDEIFPPHALPLDSGEKSDGDLVQPRVVINGAGDNYQYTDYNYWRTPVPTISLSDDED